MCGQTWKAPISRRISFPKVQSPKRASKRDPSSTRGSKGRAPDLTKEPTGLPEKPARSHHASRLRLTEQSREFRSTDPESSRGACDPPGSLSRACTAGKPLTRGREARPERLLGWTMPQARALRSSRPSRGQVAHRRQNFRPGPEPHDRRQHPSRRHPRRAAQPRHGHCLIMRSRKPALRSTVIR